MGREKQVMPGCYPKNKEKLPRGESSVSGIRCGYLEVLSIESEGFREQLAKDE